MPPQLRAAQLEQGHQLGRGLERIGDRPARAERQRGQDRWCRTRPRGPAREAATRCRAGPAARARARPRSPRTGPSRAGCSSGACRTWCETCAASFQQRWGCVYDLQELVVRPQRRHTMSYKLDLSDLERDAAVSLTQQLVDRFVAAIESGDLPPGEKLAPTRRAGDGGGRQPPDRRARVPQAGGARVRLGQRGPGNLRPLAGARGQLRAGRRLAGLRAARARDRLPGAGAGRRLLGGRRAGDALARHRLAEPPHLPHRRARRRSRRRCSPRRATRRSPSCPRRASTRCASSSRSAGGASGSPPIRTRSW